MTLRKRPTRSVLAIAATLLLVAVGCGDDGSGEAIRIAPQNFAESQTITEVYAQYLEAEGFDTEVQEALGQREVVYPGIEEGEIDMIIDYIGGAQVQLTPDAEASDDADEVYGNVTEALPDIGATATEYAAAENKDAILVRPETAEELGLTTISDLAGQADDLTFGSSSECVERPSCLPAYEGTYGIEFGDKVTLEYGAPLVDGLRAEELDVILYQTTAPEIDQDGFVVLEDDEGIQLAQNIVPIVRDETLEATDGLAEALNTLSEMITTDDLIAWNVRTDIDLDDPADVATDWLEENDLL